MDRHLRLTPVAVLVLALLREGDMHPYEMMRLLRQRREDRLVAITNGTLYNTVGRLERDEFIELVGVDREGNRPERTTYTLTDAGRDAVTGWVRRELPRIDRPAEFRLALSEAHNLNRDDVVPLLRQRRQALADSLAADSAALAAANAKGTEAQFTIEFERATALLSADIDWLDSLLARLTGETLHWGIDDMRADHDYSHREATVS